MYCLCFFCFINFLLLLRTDDVSESEVSLNCIERFLYLNIGVICGAEWPATEGCVGGAAIVSAGIK